jgi:hypothetical protein
MSSNETNPIADFQSIMDAIRKQENKGVVPHITLAEGRIGRDVKPELIEYVKRVRYKRLTGIDLDKISVRHGVDYLGQIIDVVNKTIEDTAGGDQENAKRLLTLLVRRL